MTKKPFADNIIIVGLIVYLLINSIAIGIASYILPGIHISSVPTVIVLAIILGIINTFIKPVLLLLTLPITVITLGLFIFVINALLVLLASWIVPGFVVDNFWWALLFSIVISLVSWFLSQLVQTDLSSS